MTGPVPSCFFAVLLRFFIADLAGIRPDGVDYASPLRYDLIEYSKVKGGFPFLPDVPRDPTMSSRQQGGTATPRKIEGVRHIVAVTSGKGGVGKSTVAVNLACALAQDGGSVGLLDCDVYGPNVPIMLGLEGRPVARDNKILPLEAHNVKVMSMGFMSDQDTPLIWRGPMLHGVIQQFLHQVAWGELEFLVADLPPGTGDVQLTIIQSVPLTGGLVVTTPQDVALQDARKAIMMFRQVNVDILGIVENMSYFICPNCSHRSDVFGSGGGEQTSQRYDVPFLAEVPLEVTVREGGDSGRPVVLHLPETDSARAFSKIASQLRKQVEILDQGPEVDIQL